MMSGDSCGGAVVCKEKSCEFNEDEGTNNCELPI